MAKKKEITSTVDTQKKDEGEKKKSARVSAIGSIKTLAGKEVGKMTKAEQEQLLIILGQLLGVVDSAGKVRE